jgi:AraC-like DNA-binding protein
MNAFRKVRRLHAPCRSLAAIQKPHKIAAERPERSGADIVSRSPPRGPRGKDVSFDTRLEWRSIFHGRDVETTRAYLRTGFGEDVRFDPAWKRDRRIDVRSEGVDLPSIFIHRTQLATGFAMEGQRPDPHYVGFLPLSGSIEVNVRGSSIVCDPRRAFVLCRPTMPVARLRTEAQVAALVVRLSQDAMKQRLSGLLGEPVDMLPEFAPAMDLATGPGQSFARYLLLAMMDFRQTGSIPWNPMMVDGFEDFITAKLLMSHPHSYTKALKAADRGIAPRDMRRAVDYIEAKLGSPISVADIAEASGIAGRTLFKHFQDYHGVTPMQYLRNARFDRARDALRRAQSEESITAIAMAWGFSHMGRFSIEYRKRFGERPSETLRRARGRS